MVCGLCILVPVTHMPHGWTEAHTHGELAQKECGQFCHFGTCGVNSRQHHAVAYGDLWEPGTCGPTLDCHWVSHRGVSPVSKPPWRYALGDTFLFGSFSGMSNRPFSDPNFSRPCGQLAAPYLSQVFYLGRSVRSHLLSHELWVQPWLPEPPMGITLILPIFAISAPRFVCQQRFKHVEG